MKTPTLSLIAFGLVIFNNELYIVNVNGAERKGGDSMSSESAEADKKVEQKAEPKKSIRPDNGEKGKKKGTETLGSWQVTKPEIMDIKDPTYGTHFRQLYNPYGNEHNLYHYRDVFNADNSYMLGLQSDQSGKVPYHVVLYTGNGKFIRTLFRIGREDNMYSWKLVWDRRDPKFLYTYNNKDGVGKLVKFNVDTKEVTVLKTFDQLIGGEAGLTLNQAGDRILVAYGFEKAKNKKNMPVIHTFHLPDMTDERSFVPELPDFCLESKGACNIGGDKIRYIGYKNYISYSVKQNWVDGMGKTGGPKSRAYIYDDTGIIYRQYEGMGFGHTDCSPDGKFPYYSDHHQKVHILDFENNTDKVVFEVSKKKPMKTKFMHITWPDNVKDWFILAITPNPGFSGSYKAPFDEIMQVYVDGKTKILARGGNRQSKNFWAQSQPSVSADGSRISFNSNWSIGVKGFGGKSSGTIDQNILYLDGSPSD